MSATKRKIMVFLAGSKRALNEREYTQQELDNIHEVMHDITAMMFTLGKAKK